jgi:type VI secretion system protein ImpG
VNPVRDELLEYYERELTFLRGTGADFADKYPKIASRLVLEPDRCEDPHVERMLEAFAFLAARVHLKIDDDFPEITESLLSMLYPHYIRPIPSMSVVEFHLDPQQGKLSTGFPMFRAPPFSIPSRWMACRANFARASTLPCGRFTSASAVALARAAGPSAEGSRGGGGVPHRAGLRS